MTVQQAVFQTILYLDMFAFAPTLLEIEKWLLKHDDPVPSLTQIQDICDDNPFIVQIQGFFILKGKEELVDFRKRKYNYTDQKWKRVKPYLHLLAIMPHVQAIWFVNSMGWNNARQKSDIDLLIVTTPGKIWSARFFTTALMKILRQRPHEQKEERAICLSLYVAADSFSMEPYKIGAEDIHFSFWASQFYPIYDNGQFQEYIASNSWLNNIFCNLTWIKQTPVRKIQISWAEKIIKKLLRVFCIEPVLKKIQTTIMPKQIKSMANIDNRVVINDHILKLHTNDARYELQQNWEKKVAKYAETQ